MFFQKNWEELFLDIIKNGMETTEIAVFLFFVLILLGLFSVFIFMITEVVYVAIFKKPLYLHFYLFKKKLHPNQQYILQNKFQFYKELDEKKQLYFSHRVAVFIEKYNFIGKEDFVITDEVKILIAATSTMLTFGMRNYIYTIIEKIIIYPKVYFSTVSEQYHKGEFNPRMKSIVFSWEDFLNGYEINNDNLNLGIHEFAHVLHHHGLKNDDISATIFATNYKKIKEEVKQLSTKES